MSITLWIILIARAGLISEFKIDVYSFMKTFVLSVNVIILVNVDYSELNPHWVVLNVVIRAAANRQLSTRSYQSSIANQRKHFQAHRNSCKPGLSFEHRQLKVATSMLKQRGRDGLG